MTEEAAIGASQTAESAQAEQAAPKYFDVNVFLKEQGLTASENFKAAASNLSEDEHIGLDATAPEPLVNQAERDALLETPTEEPTLPTLPCHLTLEQYLRIELDALSAESTVEYRIVARKNIAGDVLFYIHPFGQNGMSRDFAVMGELARNITKLTA